MACKIDETVKLIDEFIESEQWVKYNEKSGLKGDNKKLEEAIAKLKAFESLKMQIQSTTTGSEGSSSSNTKQKSNTNNKFDSDLDSKIASKLAALYSEIEVLYLNGQKEMRRVIDELSGDIVMFQLSKKRKDEFEQKLRKDRPELDGIGIDKILRSIEEFSETESKGDEKLMKKLELLALHWTAKGNVILPEDSEKVLSALKIADKNKFDPFSYDNPNDINNAFSPIKEKESTVDPDTFLNKGFSNKREIGNGVVTYDVANTEIGMESSRKIMDSHYDTNFNPWCLLFRNSYGLTENSSKMWYKQYPGNKKIAFKDGKLISFYGGDTWWDIHDTPHKGIPIINRGKFIDGENRVRESSIVDENDANKVISVNGYELGINKPGNEYKKWSKDKKLLLHITKEGTKITTDTTGKISTMYPDGSGNTLFPNGKIHKKVLKDGSFTTWDEDGNVIAEYKVGKGYTKWFSNGNIKETGDSPYSDNNVKIYYEDGSLYEEKIDYTTYKRYDKKGFLVDVSYPNTYILKGLDYLGSVSYNSENTEKTIIADYSEGKFDKYTQKTVVNKDGTIKIYKKDSDNKIDEIIYPDGRAEMYDARGRIIQTISKDGEIEVKKYGILDNIKSFIGFQKTDDIIKGAAVVNKKKILIDIENRSTDTLAHEYAHFYIAAFRDTPIVQEAIKKFGGEEQLVQVIGEEVVKRKGDAYNWWKEFSEWLKDLVDNLDRASKEKLVSVLTDAFLTNTDLSNNNNNNNNKQSAGFNGYVSIKDTGGKGSVEGDAKDEAMREIADGFVGEIEPGKLENSSTGTSYKELKDNYSGNVKGGSITYYGAAKPTIVMLARNGSLKGKQLEEDTKDVIREYFDSGATFVVGDMPDVDSQFIDYLDEIGASYKIYHTGNTPRIKKQESKVYSTTYPGSESEVQSYKPNYSNSIDVDAELKEKIKFRLSETYKNVDLSKITLASSNAAINFLNNNSIENVPYQYADVYIDVLRNTTFVNNTINNISKYKNISIVDAEKLLIESIGKNYIEYSKNGIGDKYIASYARKIWNFILDFFGKFDNTINEINTISERFFNGENSDAISYYPKKGFEKVNTELTFKDQPFAGNVLKTIVSSNKSISFTGSASLALQGDIYRKGKNGITDLHDLDFIVHGEKALDAAKSEVFKNFSAFEIYDFGLSNGKTERISTLIVVPKEYKIPRSSIQRNKNLRVISYKIYDSKNNVVGTYNATVDNNGQIESENTTGFKAVIVDLMQESKDESKGTMYYSDTLKTEIKLANPDDVFKAKNDIGKDIPRNKDILDSTSFYKSNRYKQFSKDDIEAAKDIMANNKKECE